MSYGNLYAYTFTIDNGGGGGGSDATSLQGQPISDTTPIGGQVLQYNDGAWEPVSLGTMAYQDNNQVDITGGDVYNVVLQLANMTSAIRNGLPALAGLMVYDTNFNQFFARLASGWQSVLTQVALATQISFDSTNVAGLFLKSFNIAQQNALPVQSGAFFYNNQINRLIYGNGVSYQSVAWADDIMTPAWTFYGVGQAYATRANAFAALQAGTPRAYYLFQVGDVTETADFNHSNASLELVVIVSNNATYDAGPYSTLNFGGMNNSGQFIDLYELDTNVTFNYSSTKNYFTRMNTAAAGMRIYSSSRYLNNTNPSTTAVLFNMQSGTPCTFTGLRNFKYTMPNNNDSSAFIGGTIYGDLQLTGTTQGRFIVTNDNVTLDRLVMENVTGAASYSNPFIICNYLFIGALDYQGSGGNYNFASATSIILNGSTENIALLILEPTSYCKVDNIANKLRVLIADAGEYAISNSTIESVITAPGYDESDLKIVNCFPTTSDYASLGSDAFISTYTPVTTLTDVETLFLQLDTVAPTFYKNGTYFTLKATGTASITDGSVTIEFKIFSSVVASFTMDISGELTWKIDLKVMRQSTTEFIVSGKIEASNEIYELYCTNQGVGSTIDTNQFQLIATASSGDNTATMVESTIRFNA